MKTFATVVALSVATLVTAPAFAQTIKPAASQAECEKDSSMKWDDASKTCIKK
jgi:multisubunit Na+/H+ antiporter MnhG subunit